MLRQFLQVSGVSEEAISRAIDQRDRVSEALRSKNLGYECSHHRDSCAAEPAVPGENRRGDESGDGCAEA